MTAEGAGDLIRLRLAGANVVFSTRSGGVSEGPYRSLNLGLLTGDDRESVVENRRRLARVAGVSAESVAMGWQVHGDELAEWSEAPAGYLSPGAELPRVDAHHTQVPGLALLVLTADCLPLALASADRLALVHCGWRGIAAGIVERALECFDEPPAAAIGPGIGACCYEVGPEVQVAFSGVPGALDGRMLDLRAAVAHRLRAGGVREIENVAICTSCRPELFFSHRREHGVTGRQGALAWLAA